MLINDPVRALLLSRDIQSRVYLCLQYRWILAFKRS